MSNSPIYPHIPLLYIIKSLSNFYTISRTGLRTNLSNIYTITRTYTKTYLTHISNIIFNTNTIDNTNDSISNRYIYIN